MIAAITFTYVVLGILAFVFIAGLLYWFFISRPEAKEATEEKKKVEEEKKLSDFYKNIKM